MESNRNNNNEPRRIVVKVGTRLLTHSTGKLNLGYIESLVRVLADLRNQGREIVLVSSGAIGAGMGRLGIDKRPDSIQEKQACAAVGQGLLIQRYEKIFSEYGLVAAQILLTRTDLVSRRRYINSCNTILTLLGWGAIPVVNENDTVSVQEIEFGDNDSLSALVAGLCDADLLVILTNIAGLHKGNPCNDPGAPLVTEVKTITPEIKSWCEDSGDELSTGGMITKLQAAEIATCSGVGMHIADGREPTVINAIIKGEKIGTYFHPQKRFLNRRKRWIAYGMVVEGMVVIDGGAREALCESGKSLLPVGVVDVKGSFNKGDLVSLVDEKGREIGRGLTNFSSLELSRIKNHPSSEIDSLIGRQEADEVIHRNNMIIY